jgi:hypothetical protein
MKTQWFVGLCVVLPLVMSDRINIGNWFNDLANPKPTTLLRCPSSQEGTKFRLPQVPRCNQPAVANDSKILELTVFWEDINHATFTGHECWGVQQAFHGICTFCKGDRVSEGDQHALPVTQEQCRKMVKESVSPNNERMERIQEGCFGTKDLKVPEHWWWSRNEAVRTNYYFVTVKLNVGSKGDSSIKSTANTVATCKAEEGQCQTVKGVLVWEPNDYKSCRIKQGTTTSCIQTLDVITCPDVHMSFSGFKLVVICNITIGISTQGIMFTTSNKDEPITGMVSTSIARKGMGFLRRKRNVAFVSSGELNARMQFMFNFIKDNSAYNIAMFHDRTCVENQLFMNMLLNDAQNGNPTRLARSFLNNDAYRYDSLFHLLYKLVCISRIIMIHVIFHKG